MKDGLIELFRKGGALWDFVDTTGQKCSPCRPLGVRVGAAETAMQSNENPSAPLPGHWASGTPPANVSLGANTSLTGELAFKRFRSKQPAALVIGAHGTMDGVHFALGENGRVEIGDYCYFTNAVLLCE